MLQVTKFIVYKILTALNLVRKNEVNIVLFVHNVNI